MASIKNTIIPLHILVICKVFGVFLLCVFCSCSRRTIPVRSERADSVRVERVTEYRERLRDTTIFVAVPVESRETLRRDSSRLETSVAWSQARIGTDGTLFHTLENKPISLPAKVQIRDSETSLRRDSIYSHEIVREVPVKFPLSWWETFWIRAGQVAVGMVALFVGVRFLFK